MNNQANGFELAGWTFVMFVLLLGIALGLGLAGLFS
jgi:hypothetical protein